MRQLLAMFLLHPALGPLLKLRLYADHAKLNTIYIRLKSILNLTVFLEHIMLLFELNSMYIKLQFNIVCGG